MYLKLYVDLLSFANFFPPYSNSIYSTFIYILLGSQFLVVKVAT